MNTCQVPRLLTVFALLCLTLPALANPPSHAPAHGWRKKHDPEYQGYTGKKWSDDYGVTHGQCDSGRLATALGAGAAGAVIGESVGGDKGAVVGAIAGILIGVKLGEHTDNVDRGCVSHALDLAPPDQVVIWTNPNTRQRYTLTPRAARSVNGRVCRDMEWGGGMRQTACLGSDGSWAIIGH